MSFMVVTDFVIVDTKIIPRASVPADARVFKPRSNELDTLPFTASSIV